MSRTLFQQSAIVDGSPEGDDDNDNVDDGDDDSSDTG